MWGIMPRNGSVGEMRWFAIPGIVMGHIMGAYTQGSKVIVDTPASPGNCFCFFRDKHGNLPSLSETIAQITRITFDLSKPDAETVTLEPIQGAYGDMPKIDDRFAMEKYRVGWFAFRDFPRMGVAQIDWDTRDLKFHDLKNAAAQEPLFIPRSADAPEADGFILTVVDRFVDKTTDLLILDGNDVSRTAIATVKLPFALPMAFHGSWMPA
jgi:carotenoid cleavage dioxygenase